MASQPIRRTQSWVQTYAILALPSPASSLPGHAVAILLPPGVVISCTAPNRLALLELGGLR
jgi:hypothetical protein